jgi:hypothetical protein
MAREPDSAQEPNFAGEWSKQHKQQSPNGVPQSEHTSAVIG